MSNGLRWRIISLQVVLIVIFAFGAGVGFWAHNFTHDEIGSQLREQEIVFPLATSAEITELPPADASQMSQYSGKTLTTGDQARVYAEHFIHPHLNTIGRGKPYDYYSSKSRAEAKTNPTQSAADQATALTLFRGETLRSLLNQAWAFWFIGDIAFYAGIGLILGMLVIIAALAFEIFIAPRYHRTSLIRSMAA